MVCSSNGPTEAYPRTETGPTDQHLVHDHSQGPPVAELVIARLHEDFRSNVVWCSNCGISLQRSGLSNWHPEPLTTVRGAPDTGARRSHWWPRELHGKLTTDAELGTVHSTQDFGPRRGPASTSEGNTRLSAVGLTSLLTTHALGLLEGARSVSYRHAHTMCLQGTPSGDAGSFLSHIKRYKNGF